MIKQQQLIVGCWGFFLHGALNEQKDVYLSQTVLIKLCIST